MKSIQIYPCSSWMKSNDDWEFMKFIPNYRWNNRPSMPWIWSFSWSWWARGRRGRLCVGGGLGGLVGSTRVGVGCGIPSPSLPFLFTYIHTLHRRRHQPAEPQPGRLLALLVILLLGPEAGPGQETLAEGGALCRLRFVV